MIDAPAAEATEDPPPAPLPWPDLVPDRFQLLRLAPLPTDRQQGARPLRYVEFGWVERHSTEHSLLRLQIRLPGQKLRKEQNRLDVHVDHRTRRVFVGEPSGLQMEPSDRGLGRFCLAQAVQWLQRHWPQYHLEGGALPAKDGLNEDNRLRRDHVLRSVGLAVDYADGQLLKASLADARVDQLKGAWNDDKVQRVSVLDTASMLLNAEQQLQHGQVQLRERDARLAQYRHEDASLRFTITCLVAFAVFQAGLLIWIATR